MNSNSSVKTRPSLWDGLVVLAVIALAVTVAVTFYARQDHSGPLTVVISVGGEVAERGTLLDMSGIHEYTNNGYTLTVDIADGEVNVTHSDCPGRDCQHSPAIRRAGQSIVCLPAQIVIHLEGPGSGPDVIVG